MAWTIDQAFVHAFDATMQHLSSEGAENIRSTVRNRPGVRGKTFNIERISGVEPIEITSRHQTTQLTPFPHSRRRLTVGDWGLSEMIDDIDKVKMLISPESDYARGFAMSYNRRSMQTIFRAMTGNSIAVDNADTQTNIALPAAQFSAGTAGTGLTMANIRTAKQNLDDNGVDPGNRHAACVPAGIRQLLADSTVTSSDFSTLNALSTGGIPDGSLWMGFRWHMIADAMGAGTTTQAAGSQTGWTGTIPGILPRGGTGNPNSVTNTNMRGCCFWGKNSMVFSPARDFQVEMPRDPSIWNNLRVMVKVSQGATRVEDEACYVQYFDATA